MTGRLHSLLDEIFQMPMDDQAEALRALRERVCLDDELEPAAWSEIERRAREAIDGTDPGCPIDEVLAEIEARRLPRRTA